MHRSLPGIRKPRRWPVWLVALLGLLWVSSMLESLVTGDEMSAEDAGPAYAIYIDRELRLLDSAGRESGWRKWMLGYDADGETEQEHLDDLRKTLELGAERGALDFEGQQARIILALRDGEREAARQANDPPVDDDSVVQAVLEQELAGEKPSAEDLKILADWVAGGEARAWEAWLLGQVAKEEALPEGTFDAYEGQNRRHAERVIAAGAGALVLTAIGVVLLPFVCWRWKRSGSRRESRWPATWGVAAVLGTFFAVELGADLTMEVFWLGMTSFPWELPDWFWTLTWMWGDLVWRFLPVAFAVIFLFRSPGHLWRSFRLRPQGAWAACFAAFSVLWILQGWLYMLAEDASTTDPTDFLDGYEMTPDMVIFIFLSTCVAAPVTEEIMCRGVLFLGLKRRLGPWPALLVSSVIFGLLHWQYDAVGIAGVTMMGIVAALLVWRTGSLYPAIALHTLFNLAVTIHSYVVYQWPIGK